MRISIDQIILVALFIYSLFMVTNAQSEQAPNFNLPGDNTTINLDQYRGQVVYLGFWASWCNTCEKSFTWMNTMQSRYGKGNFKVVAVNLDTSHEKAKDFLETHPAQFEVAYDPERKTAEAYKLSAMPNSFLINKKGEVVYNQKGFDRKAKTILEERIQQLIGHTVVASQ